MKFEIGKSTKARLMVKKLETREAVNGNKFLWGDVFDKDGTYAVCIWNGDVIVADPQPGDVLAGSWKAKEFKNKLQLDLPGNFGITRLTDVTDRSTFVKVSQVTKEIFLAFYEDRIEPMLVDEAVRGILAYALMRVDAFWTHPAAKSMHHNHQGGLAEHTFNMLNILDGLVGSDHINIKRLNTDVVVAGIILHDFLKIKDFQEVAPGQFDYTEYGNLVGHIGGIAALIQYLELGEGVHLGKNLKMHITHVCLAHHGPNPAWGSPISPSTPEAWMVHLIDMLDGKLEILFSREEGDYIGIGEGFVYFVGEKP